jgi:hypothetical protein
MHELHSADVRFPNRSLRYLWSQPLRFGASMLLPRHPSRLRRLNVGLERHRARIVVPVRAPTRLPLFRSTSCSLSRILTSPRATTVQGLSLVKPRARPLTVKWIPSGSLGQFHLEVLCMAVLHRVLQSFLNPEQGKCSLFRQLGTSRNRRIRSALCADPITLDRALRRCCNPQVFELCCWGRKCLRGEITRFQVGAATDVGMLINLLKYYYCCYCFR